MEGLHRNILPLIFRHLTLRCKRNLMQVSKSCYWWIHPFVVNYTVPRTGMFKSFNCAAERRIKFEGFIVCGSGIQSRSVLEVHTLPTMECVYGHRLLCHKKDQRCKGMRCPTCKQPMFSPEKMEKMRIKRQKK
jgi:hypothetical protein